MATTISNARAGTKTSQPAVPAGSVTPASANDGNGYTWSVIGESANGDTLLFSVTGNGSASSGSTSGARLTESMATAVSNTVNYVQVSAVYSGTSNATNWTVQASSAGGVPQTFRRGTGGGGGGAK